jgi:hypothetical protein
MLKSEVSLVKYQNNPRFLKNMICAWRNPVFGGNVFTPIRRAQTGIGGTIEKSNEAKKIQKKNSLFSKIAKMGVDYSKEGGLYHLANIKTPQGTFLDIQILIPGASDQVKELQRLRKWDKFSRKSMSIVPKSRAHILASPKRRI